MTTTAWKIGALARRTGLSVRALHHYDAIGLLSPSSRTPAGHRLYGRADVERLQQIQSLRLMGFPLDEVRRLLDDGAPSPRQVIDLHLARLREQIARREALATRLSALATQLDAARVVSVDDLCRLIRGMTTMERHFTAEQLETLRERREQVGEARMQAVAGEWAELLPAVRSAMARGAAPTSPEVLALARRWQGLVDEFTGGDPAIARGVMRVYEDEGPALRERHGDVPGPELFAYIGPALAALREQRE